MPVRLAAPPALLLAAAAGILLRRLAAAVAHSSRQPCSPLLLQAYDLTAFMDRHPAGSFLLRLAIGRDCTALFESYHLRPEVAVSRLRMLPVLQDFPVHAVPRAPRPNDSEIYNAIRDRVRTEVFAGNEATGAHRSGSEGAAATILGYAGGWVGAG